MRIDELQFRKQYTVQQILDVMQEDCNHGLYWPKNVQVYNRKVVEDIGYKGVDWNSRILTPFSDILSKKVTWSPALRRMAYVCLNYDYYERELFVFNIHGGQCVYLKLYWDKFYNTELGRYLPPKKNKTPSALY